MYTIQTPKCGPRIRRSTPEGPSLSVGLTRDLPSIFANALNSHGESPVREKGPNAASKVRTTLRRATRQSSSRYSSKKPLRCSRTEMHETTSNAPSRKGRCGSAARILLTELSGNPLSVSGSTEMTLAPWRERNIGRADAPEPTSRTDRPSTGLMHETTQGSSSLLDQACELNRRESSAYGMPISLSISRSSGTGLIFLRLLSLPMRICALRKTTPLEFGAVRSDPPKDDFGEGSVHIGGHDADQVRRNTATTLLRGAVSTSFSRSERVR